MTNKFLTVKLKIYEDRLLNDVGFDNCSAAHNGEYNVLDKIIRVSDFVLDIGANCGEWGKRALERGANVIAFEPVLHEFAELQKISNPNIRSYQIALNDRDGTETFYVCTKPLERGGSSFFRNPPHWNKISVATRSLDSFMSEHGIDYVDFAKIDTEGAEANILYGAENALANQNIACIQFEYGGTYPDAHKTLYEVYQYLARFGYKIYRIVPDGVIYIDRWHDELENNLYSNYVSHSQNVEFVSD